MTERYATATIKRQGKDEPWIVFHGRPGEIQDDIIDAFGLAVEDGATLRDVVLNAQSVMNGKAVPVAIAALGGTVIESTETSKPEAPKPATEATEKPDRAATILAQIAAATSVEGLKELWAENQAEFANAEVMQAWKARGKALKSA